LKYLSNWDNPWPTTDEAMGKIVGITRQGIQKHFKPAEIAALRCEGLELRKQNSSAPRAAIYDSMAAMAVKGNTTAQKEFLDRTEGKITEKIQHGFDMTALDAILSALPSEYADAVRAQLAKTIKK